MLRFSYLFFCVCFFYSCSQESSRQKVSKEAFVIEGSVTESYYLPPEGYFAELFRIDLAADDKVLQAAYQEEDVTLELHLEAKGEFSESYYFFGEAFAKQERELDSLRYFENFYWIEGMKKLFPRAEVLERKDLRLFDKDASLLLMDLPQSMSLEQSSDGVLFRRQDSIRGFLTFRKGQVLITLSAQAEKAFSKERLFHRLQSLAKRFDFSKDRRLAERSILY